MFTRRLQEVRKQLENSRLDALLVSHLPHVRYLTGFSGSNGLCIITRQNQYFLTDRRYRDQVKSELKGFVISIAGVGLLEAARQFHNLNRRKRIGFESQYMSVATLGNLKKLFPHSSVVPVRSVIESIAAVKDEAEIGFIQRAVDVTDRVFQKILGLLKAGISELEVSAEISYWHKRYGAEGDAFEPIVASGSRGALPHGRASEKKIRKGDFVTLDFGCRCNGYNSDLTRTVAVGRPGARAKKMYRVVLEAQCKAIDASQAGARARDLDRLARNHIKREGFGRYFSHSLGHGLGIEIHEQLRLSASSKEILKAGNVVTIEPGIYVPGFGGVRIEDDIVIRQNGCEVLNIAPKELIIL
jgi:Xaa-Pro aminopeptidase